MEDKNLTPIVIRLRGLLELCGNSIKVPDNPGTPFDYLERQRRADRKEMHDFWNCIDEMLGQYGVKFEGLCQQRADNGLGPTQAIAELIPVLQGFREMLNSEQYLPGLSIEWEMLGPGIDYWLKSASMLEDQGKAISATVERGKEIGPTVDAKLSMMKENLAYQYAVESGWIINGREWTQSLADLVRWLVDNNIVTTKNTARGVQYRWKEVDKLFIFEGRPVTCSRLAKECNRA